MKLTLLIYLLVIVKLAVGQSIDSLWHVYNITKEDTSRIEILQEQIAYAYDNINLDSELYYYNMAIKMAESKVSKHLKYKKLLVNSLKYAGIVSSDMGDYEKAIDYYSRSLNIAEQINDTSNIAKCYTNIGNVYYYLGRYDKSIENHQKSLKLMEQVGHKSGIANCYSNIGVIHMYQKNYKNAIEYFELSLKLYEELKHLQGMCTCYNNLGFVYHDQMINKKALEYYEKSLEIALSLNNVRIMMSTYNNIGIIYKESGDFEKAIDYYNKSLGIAEMLEDKTRTAQLLGNISSLHYTLADSIVKDEKLKKIHFTQALDIGIKAYNNAKEINAVPLLNNISLTMMNLYNSLGNKSKALEFAVIALDVKDSLFGLEKTEAIAEMETKYQTEKKQLQIENLNKEKELQQETIARKEAENKRQKVLIYSFVLGFIIILIFSIIVYRLFIQKKKANVIIARKNQSLQIAFSEINMQKEEIEAQRDEITAQRDNIQEQKNIVDYQKHEIEDSINYAKRIQLAVIPNLSNIFSGEFGESNTMKYCIDHFVLFRPKDIVSGDFYWANRINETIVVAVADCTGHGVPGAFMSMLGISFLNEIVRKKEVTQASIVLDMLRSSIIEALSQTGEAGTQKDGMDISLLAINLQSQNSKLKAQRKESSELYQVQWAGANNPLWIVKKTKPKATNLKPQENSSLNLDTSTSLSAGLETCFLELKADKMPIAIHPDMKPFTNHEIIFYEGDTVFLFSDGYVDQFGGPKGKKFLSKQFKELLLSNIDSSMTEQQNVLNSTIRNWIGDGEQIDDITVFGLRF